MKTPRFIKFYESRSDDKGPAAFMNVGMNFNQELRAEAPVLAHFTVKLPAISDNVLLMRAEIIP